MGSQSSKDIAKELGLKRLRREGSVVPDSSNLLILNWGAGSVPYRLATIVNRPERVSRAANKLRFFEDMAVNNSGIILEFSTSYHTAQQWLEDGAYVCSRAVLSGNSGEGLVITNQLSELPNNSPLYTKYKPKAAEFRVHVIDCAVVRVQKKVYPKQKNKDKEINWKIRNHENGFIFQAAENSEIPRAVLDAAVTSIQVTQLDFGGVDVIWNQKEQKPYVLEVNTAPGIEGRTLEVYGERLRRLFRKLADV